MEKKDKKKITEIFCFDSIILFLKELIAGKYPKSINLNCDITITTSMSFLSHQSITRTDFR